MQLLANIDVPDLREATAFYCAALGLRFTRRLGPAIVELSGASASIFLLERPAGSLAGPNVLAGRDYRRHWTPVHLDFAVSDLDAAVARAQAAGAVLESPVATFKWGRLAVFADPFGHGFCLLEFHGRGYEEITTG